MLLELCYSSYVTRVMLLELSYSSYRVKTRSVLSIIALLVYMNVVTSFYGWGESNLSLCTIHGKH